MNRVLSERERSLVDIAGRLADRFAERASRWDEQNSFPFENYDDLRAEGYLNLTVPEELGGFGATLSELLVSQERLAMGDAATALAVNMHVTPIGHWATLWRRTHDPGLERVFKGVVDGEVIWAGFTTEPGADSLPTGASFPAESQKFRPGGLGGGLMDAKTIATAVDGGYVLNGVKIFCTNVEVATDFTITARFEHPELGPRVGLFRTGKKAGGIHPIAGSWNTMGMRGTQSLAVKIENHFVPNDALVHSLPIHHLDAVIGRTILSWGVVSFGAVYIGIAAGAKAWAREYAIERELHHDPLVQHAFAEMDLLLEPARAMLARYAQEAESGELYKQLSLQEQVARAGLTKVAAVQSGMGIMQRVVDVVGGGAAYRTGQPIERMLRDFLAGPVMPLNNLQVRKLLGATTFGIELYPQITIEEAGLTSRSKVPAPV